MTLVLDEDRMDGKPELLNELTDLYMELDYRRSQLAEYKAEVELEIVQEYPAYRLESHM